jgi:AcrR family transcriptional regulator
MAPPSPSPAWYRKVRYHHRDLERSALARAREIVARHGPTALTLRGLARDLGVTAAALVRYFGNLQGLRAAVAAEVLADLRVAVGLGHETSAPTRDAAAAWIAYAADNPGLYRLAAGEPWHNIRREPKGLYSVRAVPSPRLSLEWALTGRSRRRPERARRLAVAVHGLALARMDGVPERELLPELDRAVEAFR